MKIYKTDVSRGICWIEIPEINFRLLCGCPADAVKHLAKRGLILPQEIDGVTFETGPNAILLSDVLLQNGEFANLAEFPVLQMLYKQGLMIPNHPNNTGKKPLLIGTAEQISAQLRYIYRGNYGLVSREEMCEAGVSEEQASEMMRLKLKFAFGNIRPASDFIDTLVIGNAHCVDIQEGVSIQRLELNIFKISYKNESFIIDLNLAPNETYECAYPLGFRRFEPEYFAVIHSGEGDGWDVNRPTMSSIITYQGNVYLIDAGPHLLNTLAALGIGIDQIDGIFHTHAHDDHFAGLTALMRAGRKIRYFATPLIRASVEKKLSALLGIKQDDFKHFFTVQDLVFDEWNNVDGLEVKPVFSPHPVETNLFVFRTLWEDGYKTYAHFADIVSLNTLKAMVTDNPVAPGLSLESFERVKNAYLMPYDLKKIDIGGGMIHGEAKDFAYDSSRILLAHRATELTSEEKEIGSCASFGTEDVLIKGMSEGFRRHAFSYLQSNFPGMALYDLRMLVNHPLVDVNPGAILIKEGSVPTDVLLLVSGQVEKLCTRENLFGSLSAGAFIGAEAILSDSAVRHTYRALSFVRVLRLPLKLYTEVIRRNGLFDSVQHFVEMRNFLNTTSLFSEGLPVDILSRIISGIQEKEFKAGSVISGSDIEVINVIRTGVIEQRIGEKVLNTLRAKDFFGEEFAILKIPSLFQLCVLEDTKVVQLPAKLLLDVPILRWKIFDNHQKQVTRLVHRDNGSESEVFIWQDAFEINVSHMDEQHKHLIRIANSIMEHLYNNAAMVDISKAFDALIDYTYYHFAEEEKLLELYKYPALDSQHDSHKHLVVQIIEYKKQILSGYVPNKAEFLSFIHGWLVKHVLDDDRKYGAFLNAKGVY
ncbi:MAG: bacteriohemerythrin [Methylococcales bacterium]|nr:bacteriohemerythrin [Methylococcales bacterium]